MSFLSAVGHHAGRISSTAFCIIILLLSDSDTMRMYLEESYAAVYIKQMQIIVTTQVCIITSQSPRQQSSEFTGNGGSFKRRRKVRVCARGHSCFMLATWSLIVICRQSSLSSEDWCQVESLECKLAKYHTTDAWKTHSLTHSLILIIWSVAWVLLLLVSLSSRKGGNVKLIAGF